MKYTIIRPGKPPLYAESWDGVITHASGSLRNFVGLKISWLNKWIKDNNFGVIVDQ